MRSDIVFSVLAGKVCAMGLRVIFMEQVWGMSVKAENPPG
jgi:hypothetical protein